VIDQFITSGEHKWGRLCGLTLLLPHGYEGQGPEHSSARLERFLQLCAEHNIQICVPTTPAQIFHLLRRQAVRPLRKPLVVFSPKSLLRHKDAVSELPELAGGSFRTVIGGTDPLDPQAVTRVVFCSGKVYYELHELRNRQGLGMWRSCASNSCTRSRSRSCWRRSRRTATCSRSPGVRRSRRTRVPGSAASTTCARSVREHNRDLYLEYSGPRGVGGAGSRLFGAAPRTAGQADP
jgi:hypothetical protein